MRHIWLTWLAIGAVVAAPFAAMLVFGINRFSDIGQIVCILGFLASVATVGVTNFGRGYWSKAGWSHSEQAPWNIPPVKRPRIGGFATGFAVVTFVVAYLPFLLAK